MPVYSDEDDIATPQWLFDLLDARVEKLTGQRFQLDAAASARSAKCERYFDRETDALVQDWTSSPTIFCNPPFRREIVSQFVTKGLDAGDSGSTVVLVLPSWPGYPWFQDLKRRGQIHDIIGPVAFERADGHKITLNNGFKHTHLVVAILGPAISAGTNGDPIGRAKATNEPRHRRTPWTSESYNSGTPLPQVQ